MNYDQGTTLKYNLEEKKYVFYYRSVQTLYFHECTLPPEAYWNGTEMQSKFPQSLYAENINIIIESTNMLRVHTKTGQFFMHKIPGAIVSSCSKQRDNKITNNAINTYKCSNITRRSLDPCIS
jgi:hypothetical protein